jgi:hypothetical protein
MESDELKHDSKDNLGQSRYVEKGCIINDALRYKSQGYCGKLSLAAHPIIIVSSIVETLDQPRSEKAS